MTHDNTTLAGVLPACEQRGVNRDRHGLLDALALVDAQGWDSEPATALLTQIRYELIRPLTIDIGLRGTAAAQAEASAWETVWLKLCDPHLRSAASPWGVIWQTARRAVLAEVLAARWGHGDPTGLGAQRRRAHRTTRSADQPGAAPRVRLRHRRPEPTARASARNTRGIGAAVGRRRTDAGRLGP